MSAKCLERHQMDRAFCQSEITAYTQCKKFWLLVGRARTNEGIRPKLPPLEERAAVAEQYAHLR